MRNKGKKKNIEFKIWNGVKAVTDKSYRIFSEAVILLTYIKKKYLF